MVDTATSTKKKILIIEDDVSLRNILSEKLVESGFDVDSSETAQQGFNKVRGTAPDLVLLDIMLPGGMNGFDVLEQMKASENLKEIPVIVLTNLDTEQKTAMDIGAKDYIIKANMSLDQVVSKIKTILS